MDAGLLRLMEELLECIEQRDAADPDSPAWEATVRIRRIEEELTARLGAVPTTSELHGARIPERVPAELAAIV
jgi:hypothetical protein